MPGNQGWKGDGIWGKYWVNKERGSLGGRCLAQILTAAPVAVGAGVVGVMGRRHHVTGGRAPRGKGTGGWRPPTTRDYGEDRPGTNKSFDGPLLLPPLSHLLFLLWLAEIPPSRLCTCTAVSAYGGGI